ncbi:MAG: hypothetical protein ABIJ00_10750 [Candidatus Eisenbacteria bacterium]
MRRLVAGILAVGLVAIAAVVCLGHGAQCEAIEGAVAIEARYHDGNPMAFCDAEVLRPGDDSEAFQTGSTDCHGAFGFVPDTTGTWKVVVDDGMGHMASSEVIVGPDGIRGESAVGGDRVREVVTGVAVIFGLFGVVALFYCRRKGGA